MRSKLLGKAIAALLVLTAGAVSAADIHNGQGEMAGEVTATSVILQSRLTRGAALVDGDLPGSPGVARFELSAAEDFADPRLTEWMAALPQNDYIVKMRISGLTPATRYFYRLRYGADQENTRLGPTATFKTLAGRQKSTVVSFVVVTGMNYAFFQDGAPKFQRPKYEGHDKPLGYPALATILRMKPDFFVGTGDNVYYDHPAASRARTRAELRKKWHEQFVQPRFIEMFRQVPTYWEKDDHDHRFNDSDPHTPVQGYHAWVEDQEDPELAQQPSNALAIHTFREQVPVVDPAQKDAVTYRTHRVSRELQIWLVEGRDYRSPNRMADGPAKALWGKAQLGWLQRTLLESDAAFKILISPTAMVGPDGATKRDSHANIGGFQHEAREFFGWLARNGLLARNFYLICGDRHWQYHAIHPSGVEEFACGALCDANAFAAISPGDPGSTDPEGRIIHKYTQRGQSGGFLRVRVHPPAGGRPAQAEFAFYDELGALLYRTLKMAREP